MREYYEQPVRYPQNGTQDPPIFLLPEQIIPIGTPQNAKQEQNIIIRLSKSIEKYGILEPLAVKPTSKSTPYPLYELIDGERRYRAAAIAGITKIPCIILPLSAPKCLQMAEIMRLRQEKLHYFALAEAFLRLINEYHMTQDEIARRMGLSQSAVANKIRLLRFTAEERRIITAYQLTERHARAFLRLSDPKKRVEIIEKVQKHALTVARTEELISHLLRGRAPETEENRAFDTEIAIQSALSLGAGAPLGAEAPSGTEAPLGTRATLNTSATLDAGATFDAPINPKPSRAQGASCQPKVPKSGIMPRKFALQDLKPLYNSIERTLGIFQKTGVAAEDRKEEDENAARIIIYIPKRG